MTPIAPLTRPDTTYHTHSHCSSINLLLAIANLTPTMLPRPIWSRFTAIDVVPEGKTCLAADGTHDTKLNFVEQQLVRSCECVDPRVEGTFLHVRSYYYVLPSPPCIDALSTMPSSPQPTNLCPTRNGIQRGNDRAVR